MLDGEAVLLDLASGAYFGLNAVGTRVWELFAAGKTYGQVRDAILAEFAATPETVESDLAELTERLLERKLAHLIDDADADER